MHHQVTYKKNIIQHHLMAYNRQLISMSMCFLCPQLSEWRSLPNSKPLASVYVKFFGQEIAFANFDKAWFDHAIVVWFKQLWTSRWIASNDFVRHNNYTFFPYSSPLNPLFKYLVRMFSRLCWLVLPSMLQSLCWLLRCDASCLLLLDFLWSLVCTLLVWLLQLFSVSLSYKT